MFLRPAAQFLVLPVPFRRQGDSLLIELQAAHGVHAWCRHFPSMIVAAPVMPEAIAVKASHIAWTPVSDFPATVQFVDLPWAYTMQAYRRHRTKVHAILREGIAKAEFLQFAIGGYVGDWAGDAAEIAHHLHRPYAIHMDRVEHELIRIVSREESLKRRLKARVVSPLMKRWHEKLIARAGVSLCNGQECFDAYGPLNPRTYLIHDIHVEREQVLSKADAARKARRVLDTSIPLRLVYAGRTVPDKAPLQWLEAIAVAHRQGVPLNATWFGDGPLQAAMRQRREELKLTEVVALPGFVKDRETVLQAIRAADLFPFTHVAPESPRCLIEALLCATPIIGYDSAYPRHLLGNQTGGRLVPLGNPQALGNAIAALHQDRAALSALVTAAYASAAHLDAASVFKFRSDRVREAALPALTGAHTLADAVVPQ